MNKNAKARLCYTDECVGKHMLITTVDINSQREQHMISTFKTQRLTDAVNLLEDGGGNYYISYKLHERKGAERVYIGWSKTPPVPAKPLYMKGFDAGELEAEVKNRKNPVERFLRLYILDGEITHYGNVYICDAILLADKITAVIMVE